MATKHLAALLLACGLVTPVMASNPACDQKASELERQIQYAKEAGNNHRVAGLEKALSAVRKNCTDAGLIREMKHDIAEQEDDIDEILEDIREKESEGRYDKVKSLERKLERERAELEHLRQELSTLEKR